jgi:hypothetical protein
MRHFLLLTGFIFLLFSLATTKYIEELKTVDLVENTFNTTYGPHFTLLKSVPQVGRFEWKIYDSEKAYIHDESEIIIPFTKILAFTSNVPPENVTIKLTLKKEEDERHSYIGTIETKNSQITVDSEGGVVTIHYFLGRRWADFTAMRMITDFYDSKNYQMEYFGPKRTGEFYATDLFAEGFGAPVIMHNAKVLDYKKTPFQRALIIDTKTLGKCLLLDQITQYCEKLGNYTNVFYDYVKEHKPKDILMIGGGDLVILKKLAQSKLWKDIDSFTLCELDNEVIEISKKHFHKDSESWLNDPKITIKVEDANKYILDLPLHVQYDAILMDTTDPVSFPMDSKF